MYDITHSDLLTLGSLPDKAEELALQTLDGFADSIAEIYVGGATVVIVSDTVLGLFEGSRRRRVCLPSGIEEARLVARSLLDGALAQPVDPNENENVQATGKHYDTALPQTEVPEAFKAAMLKRGKPYAKLIASSTESTIRLSIHESNNVGKITLDLFPPSTNPDFITPGTAPVRTVDTSTVDMAKFEVITKREGCPWLLRDKSDLFDWFVIELDFEPLFPSGMLVHPRDEYGPYKFEDVNMKCEVFRSNARELGKIQMWPFGDIFEVRENPDFNLMNVFTREANLLAHSDLECFTKALLERGADLMDFWEPQVRLPRDKVRITLDLIFHLHCEQWDTLEYVGWTPLLQLAMDTKKSCSYYQPPDTALFFAAVNDHKATVQLLIEHGANVEATNHSNRAPLLAVLDGYADIIRQMRSTDLSDAVEPHNSSLLDVAQLLIDGGANIEIRDSSGQTPLVVSVENKYTALAQLLIDKGADVNVRNSRQEWLLSYAVRLWDVGIVRKLLEGGTDLESMDENDHTPLMSAILSYKNQEMAQILLDAGATTNSKHSHGDTLLIPNIGCSTRKRGSGRILLHAGADIHTRDNGSKQALSWAASCHNIDIVRLLIRQGVDLEARDGNGRTAIVSAVLCEHQKVVEVLLDAGADTNTEDNDGDTVLVRAIALQNTELVRLLIKRGADTEARDNSRLMPLSHAVNMGNEDIVQLLNEAVLV
ncbi:ankyrin repeat-containing domain protein [Aspergillus cavernicola]|uniref:Ankyrin repeat-containing domain protein n=1 Tax=Aspergillus cavernicola TaxID=176166 RepID=A0ABR4IRY0_9EURO